METLLAKQTEIRSNIKKYLDIASGGTAIVVPRIAGKNVVILSEARFRKMHEDCEKLKDLRAERNEVRRW